MVPIWEIVTSLSELNHTNHRKVECQEQDRILRMRFETGKQQHKPSSDWWHHAIDNSPGRGSWAQESRAQYPEYLCLSGKRNRPSLMPPRSNALQTKTNNDLVGLKLLRYKPNSCMFLGEHDPGQFWHLRTQFKFAAFSFPWRVYCTPCLGWNFSIAMET